MTEVAGACWEAVDGHGPANEVVLVGCSVGSTVAQHMYHLRRDRTKALVVCGTGWFAARDFIPRRIENYKRRGLDYRYEFALDDFSESFRGHPLAEYFARMLVERNSSARLGTIVALLGAMADPDPDWLQEDLFAPVLIVSGTEDTAHAAAFELRDKLPAAELAILRGAGHACHMEQPWAFDAEVISFLRRHGSFPLED